MSADTKPEIADDVTAITAVIARLENSQRNELVEEFVSLFRADAIWTTGHGKRLIGRDAIAEFTQQVLPGAMRDASASYEIEHILFVRPDVAAVKVRQRQLTKDGDPIDAPEGSPLYVMAKEDDGWMLTACQNTIVVA